MTTPATRVPPQVQATSTAIASTPGHVWRPPSTLHRLQHLLGNRGVGALIQRRMNAAREIQRLPLMRPTAGNEDAAAAAPPGISQVLTSGGGGALDGGARSFFEPRFGSNFSQVRVHTDPRAAEAAQAVNARAFTFGSHIYFGAGEYRPESGAGRRLLAHELTHVVQQTGSSPRPDSPTTSTVDDSTDGHG